MSIVQHNFPAPPLATGIEGIFAVSINQAKEKLQIVHAYSRS